MSKRPKLDPILSARLQEMGLFVGMAYQPPYRFPRDGRKLVRVPEPGDPWFARLDRRGSRPWEDGAQVGSAHGATLDEAIEHAIPGGLAGTTLRLEHAVGRLTETIHACQN